jgi:hypothetical protein
VNVYKQKDEYSSKKSNLLLVFITYHALLIFSDVQKYQLTIVWLKLVRLRSEIYFEIFGLIPDFVQCLGSDFKFWQMSNYKSIIFARCFYYVSKLWTQHTKPWEILYYCFLHFSHPSILNHCHICYLTLHITEKWTRCNYKTQGINIILCLHMKSFKYLCLKCHHK